MQVAVDEHLVDHQLGEDREQQAEHADQGGEARSQAYRTTVFEQEGPQPSKSGGGFRRARKLLGVVVKRRVAGPFLQEFSARNGKAGARGVGDVNVLCIDAVDHHPMIAVPMADRRQRHLIQMLGRHLERARRQPELIAGRAKCFEAGAIAGGLAQLTNARKADRTSEMAADHGKACGAAIHLVDLRDEKESADARTRLIRACHRVAVLLGVGGLVADARVGGEQFFGKIQRNARLAGALVLRHALAQQLVQFGKALPQRGHRGHLEHQQFAVA